MHKNIVVVISYFRLAFSTFCFCCCICMHCVYRFFTNPCWSIMQRKEYCTECFIYLVKMCVVFMICLFFFVGGEARYVIKWRRLWIEQMHKKTEESGSHKDNLKKQPHILEVRVHLWEPFYSFVVRI